MKKTSSKRSSKSSFKRAMLLTVIALASLIVLFFLSFWITSLSLKTSQGTLPSAKNGVASPSAAAKPTYEQLEQMLAEKDREIQRLKEELVRLGGETPAPSASPAPSAEPTKTPAPTKSPSSSSSAAPTKTPAPTATVSPTKTPEPTKTPLPVTPPNAGATGNE